MSQCTSRSAMMRYPENLIPNFDLRKLVYTGQLLGIAAMGSAKTSVVLLFKRLASPQRTRHHSLFGMVIVWATFSLFALAFQCPLPEPWVFNPSRCCSHGRLIYPIIAINVLSDGLLAVFILPVIWKLKMARDIRKTVMVLFGSRIMYLLQSPYGKSYSPRSACALLALARQSQWCSPWNLQTNHVSESGTNRIASSLTLDILGFSIKRAILDL